MKSGKLFLLTLLIPMFMGNSSCVSTRVEASPYQDSVQNLECQTKQDWSYFWGLKTKRVEANPETEGTVCPCREGALSWVVVKTSLPDFLLSMATLGVVNHRKVSYGCSRPRDGEVDPNN